MAALRFAHLADLHLDTPFRGLGRVSEALQASLADASLAAWDRAVDICLAERVEFVLIAGDVYDQEEAGVRAQLRFLRGLQRLAGAGVPTFIVHGNHDPQGGRWPAIREWPAGVTVFGSADVQIVPVERDGRVLALIHGMSYPERHVGANLAARFRRRPEPVYQIGLLHASVGDHPEHGRYAPCSLQDLRASGLDYWALGHVHTREVVCAEAPAVVYPGNLQARHPGEQGPRGLYIVEAEPGAAPRLTFRAADLWRFGTIALDLGRDPAASLEEVASRLAQAAQDVKEDRGLIASADVAGATALHVELNRRGVREDLLRQLRDDAAGLPDVWWDDLRIRTRPAQERARRLEAGDFLADLLRGSDARQAEAAARVAALLEDLRSKPDLAALRREIDWTGIGAAAGDLWDEAERLAFDLLEEHEAPR